MAWPRQPGPPPHQQGQPYDQWQHPQHPWGWQASMPQQPQLPPPPQHYGQPPQYGQPAHFAQRPQGPSPQQPQFPPPPPPPPKKSGAGIGVIIAVGTLVVVGLIGGIAVVGTVWSRTVESTGRGTGGWSPSPRTTDRPTQRDTSSPEPPSRKATTKAPPGTTAPPRTTAAPRTTAPPRKSSPPKATKAPPKRKPAPPAHLQPQKGYQPVPLPGYGSTLAEAARVAKDNAIYGQKVAKSPCKKMPNLHAHPYPGSEKKLRKGLQTMADCAATMWRKPMTKAGYQATKVKIRTYKGTLKTPCGNAGGYGVAGFYCSANQQIYMAKGLGARRNLGGYEWGDYLQTLAHEYGHHIQARTGVLMAAGWHEQVTPRQESLQIRRRIELQANCFSGMAMKQSGKVSRSQAIRWADGRVDSDTHGTSEHYLAWSIQGHKYRAVYQCNTFRAPASDVR